VKPAAAHRAAERIPAGYATLPVIFFLLFPFSSFPIHSSSSVFLLIKIVPFTPFPFQIALLSKNVSFPCFYTGTIIPTWENTKNVLCHLPFPGNLVLPQNNKSETRVNAMLSISRYPSAFLLSYLP
jgi:hypothetical protein